MGVEVRTTSSSGGQKGTKDERHDLIPIGPLQELATHFGYGALKYDEHQWRVGYEWSKSYSALMRHLLAFWKGLDYDVCSNEPDNCKHTDANGEPFETGRPDTCYNHLGSHHMVAVAWHSFVLLEFKDRFPEFDDRYIVKKQARVEETGTNIKYIHLDDIASAMQEDGMTEASQAWIMDRFGILEPEPLSWVAKSTGEKQAVCICDDDERAAQENLVVHYRVIHGIKL